MAFVCAAAEGLDYAIHLAKVEYHVSEEETCWEMDECKEISIIISNVVDLNGEAVIQDFGIDGRRFLPQNALQDVYPDGEDEKRTGNVSLTIK